MELHEVLAAALQAVERANIPDDLREMAFAKAVDMAAVMHGAAPTPAPKLVPQQTAQQAENGSRVRADEDDRLGRLAGALDVSRDAIEHVYTEHDDELQLVVDPDTLGDTIKERAMNAALLLAAGRQLAGYDEAATPDTEIRKEIERIHLFDRSNYTAHMRAMSPWFNINGAGKSASFRMKPQGRSEAKKLAKELADE